MLKRVLMIIEYEGTNYVGWQKQDNGVAVQQLIENALFKLHKKPIAITGAGRTDSGVHALAQVAHFDTDAPMPAEKYAYALNTLLPPDIRIKYSSEASCDFHARFSAIKKRYRYTLYKNPHNSAFSRNTALHVYGNIDIDAMENAAKAIVGAHDFAGFMAANGSQKTTVRKIFFSGWHQRDDYICYDIEGSGFLYNMVRILVGTMLEIGKGTLPICAVENTLNTKNRKDAGSTAPAKGLTLMGVTYPGFDTNDIIKL